MLYITSDLHFCHDREFIYGARGFADMDKGLIYHVELDAHENRPLLIDEAVQDLVEMVEEP